MESLGSLISQSKLRDASLSPATLFADNPVCVNSRFWLADKNLHRLPGQHGPCGIHPPIVMAQGRGPMPGTSGFASYARLLQQPPIFNSSTCRSDRRSRTRPTKATQSPHGKRWASQAHRQPTRARAMQTSRSFMNNPAKPTPSVGPGGGLRRAGARSG